MLDFIRPRAEEAREQWRKEGEQWRAEGEQWRGSTGLTPTTWLTSVDLGRLSETAQVSDLSLGSSFSWDSHSEGDSGGPELQW